MKIRKARKEDIKRINEIYVEGSIQEVKLQFPNKLVKKIKKELDKYRNIRIKSFSQEIKLKNNYWVIAEEEKEIIGFGQALLMKGKGRLEKIYIDKKWVRQGIGYRLLRELERWLISRKVKVIEAGIYYKNIPSIKLNEKAGYNPISITLQKKIISK